MIYVVGYKQFFVDDGTEMDDMYQCGQCGQVSHFTQASKMTCGTFFWIPVIPLGASRATKCPNCGTHFNHKVDWYRSGWLYTLLFYFANPLWYFLYITDNSIKPAFRIAFGLLFGVFYAFIIASFFLSAQ